MKECLPIRHLQFLGFLFYGFVVNWGGISVVRIKNNNTNMRYFLEPITVYEIKLHAVIKKDCVKFWGDHPKAINSDEKEFLRLKATEK